MPNTPFLNNSVAHLDLILATSQIGVWELDAKTGTAVRNPRHDQIFGHDTPLDDWSAETFLDYVHDADRARVSKLLEASLKDGKPWSFETRIRRADGADRWISAQGMPKFSDSGEVVKLIGHVIDITETKQNEDRLTLLSKELDHRVSNTFAILTSMIRHTARNTDSVDDFANTLTERLAALARANKMLTAQDSERASIGGILDTELAAFAVWAPRVSLSGCPDIWLSGEASEALAMIFHELLTNAVKHGALSVPDGRVGVEISVAEDTQVTIRWTETGGPAIPPTRRVGIGSTILSNAMRDQGSVEVGFHPTGLVCDITVHESVRRYVPQDTGKPSNALPQDPPKATADHCAGLRIMVVEDDPIIGMDIADIFASRGAQVLGPFVTVASALHALRERPDLVLLDINIGRETTHVVAERLTELSVPYIVISGQADSLEPGTAFDGAQVLGKPFAEHDLVRTVINMNITPRPAA